MRTGTIFQDITGHSVSEFTTTDAIWNAVTSARPTVEAYGSKEYGAEVVSKRGGIFKCGDYDLDIDAHIEKL